MVNLTHRVRYKTGSRILEYIKSDFNIVLIPNLRWTIENQVWWRVWEPVWDQVKWGDPR